jgi:polysaccharide biosynthesis transport protein
MDSIENPQDKQAATAVTLTDYLRFIRERWWLIVLVVLIVTGVTYYFSSRQAPQYAASAEIIHQSAGFESTLLGIADVTYAYQLRIPVDARLIRSPEMAAKVKERIGSARSADELLGMISATPVTETESIVVDATSSYPDEAATVANGFAETFVATRSEELANALAAAKAVLESQIAQIPADQQDGAAAQALQDRLKQLSVMDQVTLADYRVLQPASVPSTPFAPRPIRDTLLAFAIALIAAIGLVFLLQYFDRRIKDEEAMERAFHLPVLASIPLLRHRKVSKSKEAVSPAAAASQLGIGFHGGHQALLEPYMMLRSNLRYFGVERETRLLMVTSTFPQQGKTTVTINLGLAMALAGERVLLIECDMRRPKIHEYMGLSNEVGLANVLSGTVAFESAVQQVYVDDWAPTATNGKNGEATPSALSRPKFYVLCAGPAPPNPSELVASRRMTEVLKLAAKIGADHVLVDTPPVLLVADALAIAPNVDGVIISARLGETKRDDAEKVRSLMERSGARVLGVVVGSDKRSKHGYYSYGYGYGYGSGYGSGHADTKGEQPKKPHPEAPKSEPMVS